MADAELAVAAHKRTRRFCRRCLTWKTAKMAWSRVESFNVRGRVVPMDYVFCTDCASRADHEAWYKARATNRLRMAFQVDVETRLFSAVEPTA